MGGVHMRLSGKVALVTGAGAGLGQAVAIRLAAEGAYVAAVSLYACELTETQSLAAQAGHELLCIAADVGDPDKAQEVATSVLEQKGRVDILVNNAGIFLDKPVEETSVEEWDRVLRTNLRGPFLYCRELVPAMKTRGGGIIINTSSRSGVRGFAGESAYCPSKFGLEGLTCSLALELAPWKIKVISVYPGVAMRTPMSLKFFSDELDETWCDPADLAPAFVQLAEATEAVETGRRYSAWELARCETKRDGDGDL